MSALSFVVSFALLHLALSSSISCAQTSVIKVEDAYNATATAGQISNFSITVVQGFACLPAEEQLFVTFDWTLDWFFMSSDEKVIASGNTMDFNARVHLVRSSDDQVVWSNLVGFVYNISESDNSSAGFSGTEGLSLCDADIFAALSNSSDYVWLLEIQFANDSSDAQIQISFSITLAQANTVITLGDTAPVDLSMPQLPNQWFGTFDISSSPYNYSTIIIILEVIDSSVDVTEALDTSSIEIYYDDVCASGHSITASSAPPKISKKDSTATYQLSNNNPGMPVVGLAAGIYHFYLNGVSNVIEKFTLKIAVIDAYAPTTAPATTSPPSTPPKKKNQLPLIIGAAAGGGGGVLLVVLVIAVVVLMRSKRSEELEETRRLLH